MVRNTRTPKALISTEFIFVFPIALTVVLAIMGFGFTGYQRARIDYSLAHLADQLPAGWDSMDADSLVAELVSASADVDPGHLTVKTPPSALIPTRTSGMEAPWRATWAPRTSGPSARP